MANHWEDALYRNKKGSIENNYLYDKRKIETTRRMFDYIDRHIVLNKDSAIIEFGCNLARNLREAHKRYGCVVTGIDINEECIEKDRLFFEDKGIFDKADLRNADFIKRYGDKQFDLGITMGFLMHVPRNGSKEVLIGEILRICKCVCMFEMFSDQPAESFGLNERVVVFEDYRNYDSKIRLTDVVASQTNKLKLFTYGF